MRISKRCPNTVVAGLLLAGLWCLAAQADGAKIRLAVQGGGADCVSVPVSAKIELPAGLLDEKVESIRVVLRLEGKSDPAIVGQVVRDSDGQAKLWWILPEVKANSKSVWVAELTSGAPSGKDAFAWRDTAGEHLDLLLGARKVTRYMYARDTSTPERAHETYKVYHHAFDLSGENLLTKGQGGKYTHHRGIFIGWNKLGHAGKRYDLWHMKNVNQVHQKFLGMTSGPVLARSASLIHWDDPTGEPVLAEERETTVFRQEEPTVLLLEFRTRLKAVRGDVDLDGDPEHAGFQYRPHNDVAARADDKKKPVPKEKQTQYLFHREGINPKRDKDLPWVGMSYYLNGKHYSVEHMNHQGNPEGTVYSAYRDYGRFGAFFKKKIPGGETLELRYRIRVVEGNMPSRETMAAKQAAFVDPPKVRMAK